MERSVTIALAGDTMLGRGVANELMRRRRAFVGEEVNAAIAEADVFVLNLECCISERGSPWPDPFKPFFFRAPPEAIGLLHELGVSCVTLANNHALDFGETALSDTVELLDGCQIRHVGAGRDVVEARAAAVLEARGLRIEVVGATDHPSDYAASVGRPGVAFADLRRGVPGWLTRAVATSDADIVLVTPHWGPNMRASPVEHVRAAAGWLTDAGATLVAGHSAHVFQGIEGPVLYDLGDFLDDYAVDRVLRNDLGLLFLVSVTPTGPVRLEAVPLKLDYSYTRAAEDEDADWIAGRFIEACAAFGTTARYAGGRLVVTWPGAERARQPA